MVEQPPVANDRVEWTHPHAHFHEAIRDYFKTLKTNDDPGELLNGLFAYVHGMVEDTPHERPFAEAWNHLADLAEDPNAVSDGGHASMTWSGLRTAQATLIFAYGRKAGLFETPDRRFNNDDARRALERFRRPSG